MSAAGVPGPGAPPAPVAIRPAGPEDAAVLWELILELAEYERLRDEVTGSEAELRSHLAGETTPRIEGLLASAGSRVAGYAIYYATFSTFSTRPILWLEDLYVRPEFRGQGTGKALMAELARQARARGCARLGWEVLDWNAPSIGFYEGLGARRHPEEWLLYELDGTPLQALAKRRP